jgi:hypothetical protein
MAFAYEVDPDLDSETGIKANPFVGDYDDFFDEGEFLALGVNPSHPTEAKPGSEDKVVMLAARYAAGLPLWHDGDCYDHGPNADFMGDDDGLQDAEDDD